MPEDANRYSAKKLDELVLYIALKLEGASKFGRTKLVKILFLADFEAYIKLGRAITGATYHKMEFGPCPAQFPQSETRLQGAHRAHERIVPAGPFQQRRLIALDAPDLSVFSAEEIAIVDEVIEKHWDESATDLSELSHRFAGWRLTQLGDEIPYFTALLPENQRPLSSDELARARASLAEIFPK